ncbi:tRNA (5-methylaminomethyl-2-thiouridine)(34)-methyltransferase MnmD [Synechocystis sp. PCC 7509]|uniref:tRNA (5-methylaminomethyl-2-thiouridine)(34)-methyltransferase MnmD n=1 Tax=Synechocystis sp. PCC 7509 TaxID=927677 RepID=UPI0002ACF8F6|nr:MnmC family methyltransferase [Synechocystis sp. PCC 7509]
MTCDLFLPQLTADNSYTFYCEEFGETFHSQQGAKTEAEHKFAAPTKLNIKAHQPVIRLLDICYGLGYNTAAALAQIWATNPHCFVEIVALESNLDVPKQAITDDLIACWQPQIQQILTPLANNFQVETGRCQASLIIGDARETIKLIPSNFTADAIFLDPFSPPKCPQLWTVEFIQLVASCLHAQGILATYSAAAAVRTALIAAGLHIGAITSMGRRSPSTIAARYELPPLSVIAQEHLLTRAAIPYRDPTLQDLSAVILLRRQQEQQISLLEPTARWHRRTSRKFKKNP